MLECCYSRRPPGPRRAPTQDLQGIVMSREVRLRLVDELTLRFVIEEHLYQ
jgi:hypothetical protein